MIRGGYYIKARRIQESEIAFAPPHVREIWDWLIKEVNHEDVKDIKRGSTMRSIRDIREGLKWYVGYRKETYSKSKCEMALNWLRKRGMIETTKTTRGMIVTVCNYDTYQNPKNYETNNEKSTKATRNEQHSDTINKNVKNVKNDKNKLMSELLDSDGLSEYEKIALSFWSLSKANLEEMGINSNRIKDAKAKNWVDSIRLAVETDGRTTDEFREVWEFLKNEVPRNGFTWKQNIQSGSKLREKFESILLSARNMKKSKKGGQEYDTYKQELIERANA